MLFISFILSTWEGMRWGFRGITGEGKRGNGRRYSGRDEMDIQRENGAREMGKREHILQIFCRHLLLFSSTAFEIAGMREEAAGFL